MSYTTLFGVLSFFTKPGTPRSLYIYAHLMWVVPYGKSFSPLRICEQGRGRKRGPKGSRNENMKERECSKFLLSQGRTSALWCSWCLSFLRFLGSPSSSFCFIACVILIRGWKTILQCTYFRCGGSDGESGRGRKDCKSSGNENIKEILVHWFPPAKVQI